MKETCPSCNFRFERIEGHWIGAIGLNTIVSFSILFVSLFVSFIRYPAELPVVRLIVLHGTLALAVPLIFFPVSRTLWTAIDLVLRPPEPDEMEVVE